FSLFTVLLHGHPVPSVLLSFPTRRSSDLMLGLSPSAGVAASGTGVAAAGLAAGVRAVVPPRPSAGGVVDDAGAGGEAAEGEVPVLAAALAVDGAAGGRVVEADVLGEAGADEDGDGGLVGVLVVPGLAEEHGERVGAALHSEPGVDVVGACICRAGEELLDVVGVEFVVGVEERGPLRVDEVEARLAG